NAERLENRTVADIMESVVTHVGTSFPRRFRVVSPVDDPNRWTRIAGRGIVTVGAPKGVLTPLGAYTPELDGDSNVIRKPDLVLLVTGTEDDHGALTSIRLVRMRHTPHSDVANVEVHTLVGDASATQE